jgi:hypothetical protein
MNDKEAEGLLLRLGNLGVFLALEMLDHLGN